MNIGEFCRISNSVPSQIRFYERKGLFPKLQRGSSGYRIYSSDLLTRVKFIQNAQELGFTLAEIKGLLNLNVASLEICETVKQEATQKIKIIESKLLKLNAIKKALAVLVKDCDSRRTSSTCPILDHLKGDFLFS